MCIYLHIDTHYCSAVIKGEHFHENHPEVLESLLNP